MQYLWCEVYGAGLAT